MDWDKRCLRLCALMLLMAVLLRLGAVGAFAPLGAALESEGVASFLVYLYTGRVVRLTTGAAAISPTKPPLAETRPEEPEPVTFTPDDLSQVSIQYQVSRKPDLEALLTGSLDWNLTGNDPTVLIVHTHTTESYTKAPGDTYEESSAYRTLDPEYNMLCLGALVADRLEAAGIGVIHDTTLHDYPSYNGSYNDSAESVQALLAQYPSITLVLDLHRDAAQTDTGQLATWSSVDGQNSAQLMFVVGTDAGGLSHPDWQENLALALKLQVLLEQKNPGICRDLKLVRYRYNQHLGDRALLVEIGAAGDSLAEAKVAAGALADAIIALAGGSN